MLSGFRNQDYSLPGGGYHPKANKKTRFFGRKRWIFAGIGLVLFWFIFYRGNDTVSTQMGSKEEISTNSLVASDTPVLNAQPLDQPGNTQVANPNPNSQAPITSTKPSEALVTQNIIPDEKALIPNLVEDFIKIYKVVIFSKSECPYCKNAKAILNPLEKNSAIIEIDLDYNGLAIHNYLKSKYSQTTVPYIFIKEKLIGGLDKLQELRDNGNLDSLLSKES